MVGRGVVGLTVECCMADLEMLPVILTHVGVGLLAEGIELAMKYTPFWVTAYASWLPRVGSVTIDSICEPSRPLAVEPTSDPVIRRVAVAGGAAADLGGVDLAGRGANVDEVAQVADALWRVGIGRP